MVPFRGIFSIRVDDDISTIPATEQKHPFHPMEFHRFLMFFPQRVSMFTHYVADFTEEKTTFYS
ncbi:MAG: hypothetical protein ABSA92_09240 [Candidatus Bathyarchaeia archaeon]